jgi:hypothetical protein
MYFHDLGRPISAVHARNSKSENEFTQVDAYKSVDQLRNDSCRTIECQTYSACLCPLPIHASFSVLMIVFRSLNIASRYLEEDFVRFLSSEEGNN